MYVAQTCSTKMAETMNEVEVDACHSKLIIRTRLHMEEEFASGKMKKPVLWRKVLEQIKEQKPDFDLTKEQIIRKYLNLQTTYKRIKARNKESGRNTSTWEFFDDFEEIYSTRHSVVQPDANLISSLDETTDSGDAKGSPEPCEGSPESYEDEPPQAKKKKRRSQNEILNYLKEESRREQKRHEEIMAMEEKKLLIEERRISAMIQLKDVLLKTITNIVAVQSKGMSSGSSGMAAGVNMDPMGEVKMEFDAESTVVELFTAVSEVKREQDEN